MTTYKPSPTASQMDTTAKVYVEEMGLDRVQRNCFDGDLALATIKAEQWPRADFCGQLINPTIQN